LSSLDSIIQYQDFLNDDQLERILEYTKQDKWGIQSSIPDSPNKFLAMNLENNFFKEKIFKSIKQVIGHNYKIDRVYFNGQFYGMPGEPHCDSDQKNKFTFLIYVNQKWDFLWGGQTIFFDRYFDQDTGKVKINSTQFKSFYPTPKSALLFPSNLMHYAESPTKQCYEMRLTLAYKLERID
jgi:Rps23 Pro-64 3,4-dihydroxylase Tpa1-like proline 4-hydroxylase